MPINERFKEYKVLVTGASGGIGKMLVSELLEQGARVGFHYFKNGSYVKKLTASLNKKMLTKICFLKADLKNKNETEKLFSDFIHWSKGIDGLVNNAGDVNERKHFFDINENDMDSEISLNLKAPFYLSRLAIKKMIEEDTKGSIVNISSIAAKFGGSPYTMFYGLSKAALEAMTFSFGRFCADKGIRVNALRLGVFDTPFHKRHPKDMSERIKLIPSKRMGRPEEASYWIMNMLDKKSSFLNGQVISLTGGE